MKKIWSRVYEALKSQAFRTLYDKPMYGGVTSKYQSDLEDKLARGIT